MKPKDIKKQSHVNEGERRHITIRLLPVLCLIPTEIKEKNYVLNNWLNNTPFKKFLIPEIMSPPSFFCKQEENNSGHIPVKYSKMIQFRELKLAFNKLSKKFQPFDLVTLLLRVGSEKERVQIHKDVCCS